MVEFLFVNVERYVKRKNDNELMDIRLEKFEKCVFVSLFSVDVVFFESSVIIIGGIFLIGIVLGFRVECLVISDIGCFIFNDFNFGSK